MVESSPSAALKTPAFITTVGEDRIIRLPEEVPPGTTVAVVVMSVNAVAIAEAERKARFAAVMKAIRDAIAHGHEGGNLPSDAEITKLVEEARKARRAAGA